ncbi:hypothetical protein H7097_04440 [Aeromicrobium sp.]|nr:hypothetical protein [Candidatus Saccharibacteria bacterium]
MHKLLGLSAGMVLLFAAVPTSTNYTLKSYDVGSGGTSNSTSTNYRLNAISGEQSGNTQTSATYGQVNGVNVTQNANVPPGPTFTNPSTYYDKLMLVVNPGSNPTDTKYLIAISPDAFATTTNYVQSDNSVGASQAITNYQTYATWGGAGGITILGLANSTTYTVKVKALQGDFSGSKFGPTATAATVAPSLTMSLTTSLTSTPPFPSNFASLTAGAVVNGSADAIVTLTSNANNGGTVYARDINAGLLSVLAASSIASATADLSAVGSGYGGQVIASSQVSGGPLTSQSPFNGVANNVGAFTTGLQPVFTTVGPIATGSGTMRLKAKAATNTPAASDYADAITFIVAMNY